MVTADVDGPAVSLEPTPATAGQLAVAAKAARKPTAAKAKAPKAAKPAKVAAAKTPKAAKVKAPAKPLFVSEETVDGVLVKTSAKFPKTPGKVLKFSARWKTAGGNDNLGAWHDYQAKAIEQAKVHLADGRQAWVICGYR